MTAKRSPTAKKKSIRAEVSEAMREERAKRPGCDMVCNDMAIAAGCCACAQAVALKFLPTL